MRLAEIGTADASGIKSHLVNTVAQIGHQTGGIELLDDLTNVIVPLNTRVQGVAAGPCPGGLQGVDGRLRWAIA